MFSLFQGIRLDSSAVLIFVVILVGLKNTAGQRVSDPEVTSNSIAKTAAYSMYRLLFMSEKNLELSYKLTLDCAQI